MNDYDEARLDWSEDGPDEDDVLADNEILAAENDRLKAEAERLRAVVAAASALVAHWHEAPASHQEYVYNADERTAELIDELGDAVGGGA